MNISYYLDGEFQGIAIQSPFTYRFSIDKGFPQTLRAMVTVLRSDGTLEKINSEVPLNTSASQQFFENSDSVELSGGM